MEVDESIALLAAKLDDWFDGNITTFASQDREAQGKSLFRGIAIAKELDQLKAEGSAAHLGAVGAPEHKAEKSESGIFDSSIFVRGQTESRPP